MEWTEFVCVSRRKTNADLSLTEGQNVPFGSETQSKLQLWQYAFRILSASFPVSCHAVIFISPPSSCLHLSPLSPAVTGCFLSTGTNTLSESSQVRFVSYSTPFSSFSLPLSSLIPTVIWLIKEAVFHGCHYSFPTLLFQYQILSTGVQPEWQSEADRQIVNNGWPKSQRYARKNTMVCKWM